MSAEPDPGPLIRNARHRKGLTQSRLAALVGVDRCAVSNWETGRHYPLRHAGLLEEVLDIEIPAPARAPEVPAA